MSEAMVILGDFPYGDMAMRVYGADGEVWVEGSEIGAALGFSKPAESISNLYNRNREELEPFSITHQIDEKPQGGRPPRLYNEMGVYLLTMFARTRKAAKFRRWVVETLAALRRGAFVPRGEYDRLVRKVGEMELRTLCARYGFSAADLAKLARYRNSGVSRPDLARVFRASHGTVGKLLRAAAAAGLVELHEQPEPLRRQAERLKRASARPLSGAVVS